MSYQPSALAAPFETIFRWDERWTSIHVKPIVSEKELIHFQVTLLDGSFVFLFKDPNSGWEEGKGKTLRSKVLGSAIDEYYIVLS